MNLLAGLDTQGANCILGKNKNTNLQKVSTYLISNQQNMKIT